MVGWTSGSQGVSTLLVRFPYDSPMIDFIHGIKSDTPPLAARYFPWFSHDWFHPWNQTGCLHSHKLCMSTFGSLVLSPASVSFGLSGKFGSFWKPFAISKAFVSGTWSPCCESLAVLRYTLLAQTVSSFETSCSFLLRTQPELKNTLFITIYIWELLQKTQ